MRIEISRDHSIYFDFQVNKCENRYHSLRIYTSTNK